MPLLFMSRGLVKGKKIKPASGGDGRPFVAERATRGFCSAAFQAPSQHSPKCRFRNDLLSTCRGGRALVVNSSAAGSNGFMAARPARMGYAVKPNPLMPFFRRR
jgi:hypothetical protein